MVLYNSLGPSKFSFIPGRYMIVHTHAKSVCGGGGEGKGGRAERKFIENASRNSYTAKVMNILTAIQMFP